MAISLEPRALIEAEARALLTRANRVRPLALTETTVVAASFSMDAQAAIERLLSEGRHDCRRRVRDFIAWLRSDNGQAASLEECQRRFVFLRLRFNAVLTHLDLFSEVLTQRSEAETGVFLAGLDALAYDALDVPDLPLEIPPVVCYLQRGQGASIRRSRTRLPGGGENPVAIIMVPRERMVGSGIASSLVHETGHEGAARLRLVESMRSVLQRLSHEQPTDAASWLVWDRWCSEIIADLWSVARLGIGATLGLMGVVSLPRPFVFRRTLDEPHPIPWLRVVLSARIGNALYPHPQWAGLVSTWHAYYPLRGLDAPYRELLERLSGHMDTFIEALLSHAPAELHGRSLGTVLRSSDREPAALARTYREWTAAPLRFRAAPPTLAFAVVGQARADGAITPESEGRVLAHLLTNWALRSAVDITLNRPTRSRRHSKATAA